MWLNEYCFGTSQIHYVRIEFGALIKLVENIYYCSKSYGKNNMIKKGAIVSFYSLRGLTKNVKFLLCTINFSIFIGLHLYVLDF